LTTPRSANDVTFIHSLSLTYTKYSRWWALRAKWGKERTTPKNARHSLSVYGGTG